jgi:hypothetical protein
MPVWLKASLLAAIVVLALIQVFRPSRTNPPIDPQRDITATSDVTPAVAAIYSRACDDCHSNRTVWPWYSNIAPVSWLIVYDVNHGRSAMNFSEWSAYGTERRGKLREEICDEVSEGEMPGAGYTLIHPEAKLADADVQEVCRWTQSVR